METGFIVGLIPCLVAIATAIFFYRENKDIKKCAQISDNVLEVLRSEGGGIDQRSKYWIVQIGSCRAHDQSLAMAWKLAVARNKAELLVQEEMKNDNQLYLSNQ